MMFQLDNNKAGYTWSSKWILPYESLWGVTEKFMYLNSLTGLSSKYLPVKPKSNIEYQSDYRNYVFYSTLGYDSTDFAQFLGINSTEHYSFFEKFSGNNLEDLIDKKIRICPECIKQGYHSYRHQLLFEHTCFIHNKLLFHTEIPYCMMYSQHSPYKLIPEIQEWLQPSSDLLLQLIQKENCFSLYKEPQDILHIDIINLNDKLIIHQSSGNVVLYKYLHTLFYPTDTEKNEEILAKIDKSKAEAYWKNYCYKFQNISYSKRNFSWFSDYCYNYSQQLYEECDEKILFETLTNFRDSYVMGKLRNLYYDYDFKSIAAIITVSILTGYSYYEDRRDVFSDRWNRRDYFCFCEEIFLDKVQKCKENYLKIAYLELYKYIVSAVYSSVKSNAYAGAFSKINFYQISDEIELPIYLVIERTETIEIVEVSNTLESEQNN